jgi:regulator of replication initiation timing
MSDPLTLGLASTAVGLVNSTISLFKQVNESAKNSDDIDLKKGLSDLYNQIVELKAQILDLAQENADLRIQLNQRANINRDEVTGFYFQDDDPDPLCSLCYERDERRIHLTPSSDSGSRFCKVCHNYFHSNSQVDNTPGPEAQMRQARSTWQR